jgi:type IV pilus assembly protein PilX
MNHLLAGATYSADNHMKTDKTICKVSQSLVYRRSQREQGAALIVGLLLLLVMTIIGIAAMRGTTLQERMSANNQQQMITFQSAEAAINSVWGKVIQPAQPSVVNPLITANTTGPVTTSVITGNGTTTTAVLTKREVDLNCNGGGTCTYYEITGSSSQANTNTSETHVQRIFYRSK